MTPELSLYEQEEADAKGRLSLAAARLAIEVSSILERAVEESNLTHRELAERLGVTEGRVSQVLNGNGNLQIATLARFLAAVDREAELSLTPVGGSRSRKSRRSRSSASDKAQYRFEQVFAHEGGVSTEEYLVSYGPDCPVPMGPPRAVGQVSAEPHQEPPVIWDANFDQPALVNIGSMKSEYPV